MSIGFPLNTKKIGKPVLVSGKNSGEYFGILNSVGSTDCYVDKAVKVFNKKTPGLNCRVKVKINGVSHKLFYKDSPKTVYLENLISILECKKVKYKKLSNKRK